MASADACPVPRSGRLRRGIWSGVWLVLALAALPAGAGSDPESLPGGVVHSAALRAKLEAALAARGPGYVPRTRHLRADGGPRYSNRLLLEASPYLQQHAHNPVDWYPWGDEAFARARALGRPVLVSIGYSTCHWCHVMEEESFEDPAVAEQLNTQFVAIKVDREARPDVDAVYMTAVQAMGRTGGWPLNVWLTPDAKPFYGGTYFPPQDRGGRPGFARVLTAIHERYQAAPAEVEALATDVAAAVARGLGDVRAEASLVPGDEALRAAAAQVERQFDDEWGGLRQPIKFPATTPLRFLLRYHRRSGDARALEMATRTLEKMAAGGLRDQLGGSFHRYSTDPRWLVPHFEKMLYDNALLALASLEAWQATGREEFAVLTREILDALLRDLRLPGGGFASATDADSAGPDGEMEEGRFFTWTPDEIRAALGAPAARAVEAWFGVTAAGQLEGRSVLHTWASRDDVAARLGIEPQALDATLAAARPRLLAARAKRPPPLRDEKVVVAWNGLAVSAFARAGFALRELRYVQAAAAAADFALGLRRGERLQRVGLGGHASGPAFLEDYAFLVAGLLDLYEAGAGPRWLHEALRLQRVLDAHYADVEGGGYFRTAADQPRLIAREKPAADGAVPSGNSVAALNLLRLEELTGDAAYRERALMLLSAFHDALLEAPLEVGEMLLALDFELDTPFEVVVVRSPGGDAEPLLDVLRHRHLPNRVIAVATEGADLTAQAELVPLLADRAARGGAATAYVCENRVCRFPTDDPAVLAEQLSRVQPLAPPPAPDAAAPSGSDP